ncbi:Caltractin [Symbiodinium natans]|uniref:Caltractin protein n=1 Tax=Symbiodinium natans TaxID=878477 RepID=A0A812LK47_9DINO|nr:Caltractin [Symbiodinium natans]
MDALEVANAPGTDAENGPLVKKLGPCSEHEELKDGFQTSWMIMAGIYLVPATAWVMSVWLMYFVAGIDDPAENWNVLLPNLGATTARAVCMGLHFVTGSVITLAGVWQVLPVSKRPEWLPTHRTVGRIYVICSVLTCIGGFGFILQQHILAGGWPMSAAFTAYGCCVVAFALLAYWTARQKDIAAHRRWGLRSFAMGIASFVYRVMLILGVRLQFSMHQDETTDIVDAHGTTKFFREDPYNQFIAWFFFVGSLGVVEWYLRAPNNLLNQILLFCFFAVVCVGLALFSAWLVQRLMSHSD